MYNAPCLHRIEKLNVPVKASRKHTTLDFTML